MSRKDKDVTKTRSPSPVDKRPLNSHPLVESYLCKCQERNLKSASRIDQMQIAVVSVPPANPTSARRGEQSIRRPLPCRRTGNPVVPNLPLAFCPIIAESLHHSPRGSLQTKLAVIRGFDTVARHILRKRSTPAL